MQTKSIVSCEKLSKSYIIGHQVTGESYVAMRDVIAGKARGILAAAKAMLSGGMALRQPSSKEEFWALNDVSFEINRGEVVGIIGRNGAGKSTLLKILSRITEPTKGRITIRGRVASLLEVGTGFHPELSGRENVFLNGSILGMTRTEIKRKFEEIVAFAGVERFLDTPVKRFSSGMYVRLAFSVAAHLDPEILVVDEVLAVGDAEFQGKCLGKMDEVAKSGRTVLFVSHNMAVMTKLCNRIILMKNGGIEADGLPMEVVRRYVKQEKQSNSGEFFAAIHKDVKCGGIVELVRASVSQGAMNHGWQFAADQPINVLFVYRLFKWNPSLRVGFRLHSEDGTVLFTSCSSDNAASAFQYKRNELGEYASTCQIPANMLNFGNYSITLAADVPNSEICFFIEHAISFSIEPGLEERSLACDGRLGAIVPTLNWNTIRKFSESPNET